MQCKFCGRILSRPCELAVHEKTCMNNPDRVKIHSRKLEGWLCKGCNKKFLTRSELSNHKKECSLYKEFSLNKKCLSNQLHLRKEFKCPYCNKDWFTTIEGFKNHKRYCCSNPDRVLPKKNYHSESTRKLLSECRKQTILKQGCEQNLKHKSYFYDGKIFSSSYEVKYALYCEEHNINYILHPEPIKYSYNNKEHLYFPDFYIPSEHKYVDPKNSYLINYPQKHLGISDTEKIKLVSEQNGVVIEIIDGRDIICDNSKLQEILNQKIQNKHYRKFNKSKKSKNTEMLVKNNQIDKLGRPNSSVTPEFEWLKRKDLIINSGVDLEKFGWVDKVVKITGLSKKQIRRTVRRYKIKCFEKSSSKQDNK